MTELASNWLVYVEKALIRNKGQCMLLLLYNVKSSDFGSTILAIKLSDNGNTRDVIFATR